MLKQVALVVSTSGRRRRLPSRAGAAVVLVGVLCVLGCSSPPRYNPAHAARQKVEFLRRQGMRLNPYQQALIHQLPYESSGSGRLERDMEFILRQGAIDPGHEAGYRRKRLSRALLEQQKRERAAKAASEESGEQQVDPEQ